MQHTRAAAVPRDVDGDDTIGAMLRTWRQRRRLTQADLSHGAEVSTRHLSFIETGRARPTPEMILRLADQLAVPLGERNRLLLAGGFAPRFSELDAADSSLAVVMGGLRDLLDAHLPWPALLLDDGWDIIDSNAAAAMLLDGCDASLLEPPVNALRVTLHPGGLAPRIRNLPQWAGHVIRQVASRAERTHDIRLIALVDELLGYADDPGQDAAPTGPVLALELDGRLGPLRMFAVAARLETPNDATLEGLTLETFLPVDARTDADLRAMASMDPRPGPRPVR